jgi:SAM-dependent methyltransferase
MDGRDLRFEDGSFDFIYSSSSIEHFGSATDVRMAATEMGRVLKPGGILSLSTELRIKGTARSLDGRTLLFDPADLHKLIIEPSGCVPTSDLHLTPSLRTVSAMSSFKTTIDDIKRHYGSRLDITWSSYPHIVIASGETAWTSVHLCLRKPVSAAYDSVVAKDPIHTEE